ncbi:imelysin family protein [Spongiimicrobium salis]|uniref:imelysin family protein n=1 Tax=Spongiimicrobium salis TaxID=1667022 RepID=UPI00374D0606
MKRSWYYVALIVLSVSIWACSSGGDDDTGGGSGGVTPPTNVVFDRGAMLANWADNIIIPSYTNFTTSLVSLQNALQNLTADTNETTLAAFRTAWSDAYLAWQPASIFENGPAEDIGLHLNINTYPTSVSDIESNIANGGYNLSLPSNRDTKGFPAIDYLINGSADTDAEIVALLGQGNYLTYLEDIIADMSTLSNGVLGEWQNGFRDTFVNNDGSSATASVDRMVNDYIFYYEKFLRAGKMGIPLGVFSGTPAPNTLEAFYQSDRGKVFFLEGLDAVQDFFNGRHFGSSQNGESLFDYLEALNAVKDGENLGDIINDQLNLARTMVNGLGEFRDEIENNNPPVQMLTAYDEVQRVVPLMKVDMVSALSISVDFVDADGD